jgi:hypothetical protein
LVSITAEPIKDKNLKSIVHNYNHNPSNLIELLDDYYIYEASDNLSEKDKEKLVSIHKEKITFTENIGHSLTNWLDWVITNYEILPPVVALLKGNILERHMDLESFTSAIKNRRFTPLFRDANLVELEGISFLVSPGLLAEVNNSWYAGNSTCRYFRNLNEFLHFFFVLDFDPKFVTFAPGANYIVQDFQISKYPLEFWKTLREVVSYDFFVSEAWMLERLFHFIFTTETAIQPWFGTQGEGISRLKQAQNSSRIQNERDFKRVSKRLSVRLKRKLMRLNVRLLKRFGYSDYWPS